MKEGIISKHVKERISWLRDEQKLYEVNCSRHKCLESRIYELQLLLSFIEGVNESIDPGMEGYH